MRLLELYKLLSCCRVAFYAEERRLKRCYSGS